MLFGIFNARSATTSKTSEASEDDTYLKLVRMPIEQFERERMPSTARFIRSQHNLFFREELEKAKVDDTKRFMNRWFWFLNGKWEIEPAIHMASIDYEMILADPAEEKKLFEGTGWNSESYLAEIRKITSDNIQREIAEKKLRKRNTMITSATAGATTGMINTMAVYYFGISIWITVVPAVLAGLAFGLMLRKYWFPV